MKRWNDGIVRSPLLSSTVVFPGPSDRMAQSGFAVDSLKGP